MPGRRSIEVCGTLCGTSFEAKRWYSLDPCGCSGICVSWFVHIYALVVLGCNVTTKSLLLHVIYYVGYIPLSLLALLSLHKASTTDPGAVALGARPLTIIRRGSSTDSESNNTNSDCETANDAVARNASSQVPDRGIRRCHKCQDNYKPNRAHHDRVTGRCIVKFDHFCPWVNNAIGALNHKFFCLFLFYTAWCCLVSLFMLLLRSIHCGYMIDIDSIPPLEDQQQEKTANDASEGSNRLNEVNSSSNNVTRYLRGSGIGSLLGLPTTRLPDGKQYLYEECDDFYSSNVILGLLVASIVFLIFTSAMSCDQFEAIQTGKSKIARMKQSIAADGTTEYHAVTEEFNEMFGGTSPNVEWHWFLPIDIPFPKGMKKVVLGHDYDDSLPSIPYQESTTMRDLRSENSLRDDSSLSGPDANGSSTHSNASSAAEASSNVIFGSRNSSNNGTNNPTSGSGTVFNRKPSRGYSEENGIALVDRNAVNHVPTNNNLSNPANVPVSIRQGIPKVV